MNRTVEHDMSLSKLCFENSVWNICAGYLGGGALMQMEGSPDSKLATVLDTLAGVDAWQIMKTGMRGIASRVQTVPNGSKPFNTFTVRLARESGASTEYEKRRYAIDSWGEDVSFTGCRELLYPAITIQAYAHAWDGPVVSIGMAYTRDVIDFVTQYLNGENNGAFKREVTHGGAATFIACPWAKMQERGIRVKVWTNPLFGCDDSLPF